MRAVAPARGPADDAGVDEVGAGLADDGVDLPHSAGRDRIGVDVSGAGAGALHRRGDVERKLSGFGGYEDGDEEVDLAHEGIEVGRRLRERGHKTAILFLTAKDAVENKVDALRAGDCVTRGRLTVQVLPFVSQAAYDTLLWCCDLNGVRGEDSFVRAQWAGEPLIWHIYPQDDEAHMHKLEAFLDRFCVGLEPGLADDLRGVWRAWNRAEAPGPAWSALLAQLPALRAHAERWCVALAEQDDLASQLVAFAARQG